MRPDDIVRSHGRPLARLTKSFNNEVMALDLQSKRLLWKYTPTDRHFRPS
jgi:hypothetical protein